MQLVERRLQPLRQVGCFRRLASSLGGGVIADEVTTGQLTVLAERRLQRKRHTRSATRLVDALRIDIQELRHLVDRRLTAELGCQLPLGTSGLGQELGDVHRETDGAALVSDGTRDRLANPPVDVGAEAETTPPI